MINDPMILVLDLGLFRKEIVAEAPLAGNIYGAFVHLSKSEKNDPEFKYIYTEYSKMYKQRIHETEIHKLEAEIHKLLRANPNINKYKLDSLISRVLSYQRLNNVFDAIVKAMAAI